MSLKIKLHRHPLWESPQNTQSGVCSISGFVVCSIKLRPHLSKIASVSFRSHALVMLNKRVARENGTERNETETILLKWGCSCRVRVRKCSHTPLLTPHWSKLLT